MVRLRSLEAEAYGCRGVVLQTAMSARAKVSFMVTPRRDLVDPVEPMAYHLVSRCVRRSWLCGVDRYTGIDYSHRKPLLEQRIVRLSEAFAVDLWAYSVMSNHFHQAVHYDPLAHRHWSEDEVVRRWLHAFPPAGSGRRGADARLQAQERLLEQPERLAHCRVRLGSLSAYMQHLKQPFAYQCNREDGARGHFFEERFYSGAILDEESFLATMAYVDLNPVRAEVAQVIEHCEHTGIAHRLRVTKNSPERLEQAIVPIVSGLSSMDRVHDTGESERASTEKTGVDPECGARPPAQACEGAEASGPDKTVRPALGPSSLRLHLSLIHI